MTETLEDLLGMIFDAGLTVREVGRRAKLAPAIASVVFSGARPLTPNLRRQIKAAIAQKPKPPPPKKHGRRNLTAETGLTPSQRQRLRKRQAVERAILLESWNLLRDALVWYDAHETQIGHLPQWVDQAKKVVRTYVDIK